MNVDTFSGDPSIKWYFIASVPFMLCVLITWFLWKHALTAQQNTPYRRGIYENFFNDLANASPALWSQTGPRNYVVPKGRLAKIKWYLIRRWSAPDRTIGTSNSAAAAQDDLGVISRIKRQLIWRWTTEIAKSEGSTEQSSLALESGETIMADNSDAYSVVADGLANATEMAVVPAVPTIETAFEDSKPLAALAAEQEHCETPTGLRRLSFRSHSRGSSNGKNSGILVEEEDWQWLSQRGREGKEWVLRSAGSRERSAQRRAAAAEGAKSKDVESHTTTSKKDAPNVEHDPETVHRSGGLLEVPRIVQPFDDEMH